MYQEGCSGQGLAAIPHPESRPVIVLLGEDMDNNASEIIVLGDEEDQVIHFMLYKLDISIDILYNELTLKLYKFFNYQKL